ncbi:MAG: hypothetical protein IKW30_05070 [Lachnospiraceae bacterium]|nr:hypothetical protein [Lachnospiraceae bacterium]
MILNYLQILQDSLERKLALLTQIEEKSLEQSNIIKSGNVDFSLIDLNMDEKAKLISEILVIDNGFESLYEKIRENLITNKEKYKIQIQNMQNLIEQVTQKGSAIQVIEARNKAQMDVIFSNQKREMRTRKNVMSVAKDYYQNMNNVKHVSPQFLDHKK